LPASLAAAVSNASGLGVLVPWRADIDSVQGQIRETRALPQRPFGVNLNLEFLQEERLAAISNNLFGIARKVEK
jgi:nitronate monooxygenase